MQYKYTYQKTQLRILTASGGGSCSLFSFLWELSRSWSNDITKTWAEGASWSNDITKTLFIVSVQAIQLYFCACRLCEDTWAHITENRWKYSFGDYFLCLLRASLSNQCNILHLLKYSYDVKSYEMRKHICPFVHCWCLLCANLSQFNQSN